MGCTEGLRVVAVGADDDAAGVVAIPACESLATAAAHGDLLGMEDAVGKGDRGVVAAVREADETANVIGVGTEQLAREGTALESAVTLSDIRHKSAVSAVAVDRGVDGDIADAVGEGAAVVNDGSHDTGAKLLRGVDGAVHFQVLEGGTISIAEEGGELHAGRHVEGDGVALSVEGAGKTLVLDACHGADGDVGGQSHGSAAERYAVVQRRCESVPLCRRTDIILVGEGHHHVVVHEPAYAEGRSQSFVGHPRGIDALVREHRGRCHSVVVAVGEVA